jgi:hypothetical protein
MDNVFELLVFFVFFVPMSLLVVINVLLHWMPLELAAPWARMTRPEGNQRSASAEAASNDEEIRQAA